MGIHVLRFPIGLTEEKLTKVIIYQ
jgi:hypothetical protein